ncbi:MAG: NAD(P)H-binding protein [Peptococcaceae bacterium]|nr:NAD(P)H-binding protein [Peptococcaceae bacterium]
MDTPELCVVTGAFGYTGKYITRLLLSRGKGVKTLTGHPGRRSPFGDRVHVAPFNFEKPDELMKSLQGATTFINTYWVRFSYGKENYDKAVANTRILIKAAKEAGVRRFVHVSITNASENSPLPYFKGKGLLEKEVAGSGMSYAIIRPTVIFGAEDILINNIAWLLRRFPVFAVPGRGEYKLQPVFVEDMAELVAGAAEKEENVVMDAAGPEIYTYNELVRLIRDKVGSKARVVHVSPGTALFLSRIIGRMVNDVVLTRDEIAGLMANLLISADPPAAKTALSDWLGRNASTVGAGYTSELSRHYRKTPVN